MIKTVKELSDILHTSKSTIYSWIKKGLLDIDKSSGSIEILDNKKNWNLIRIKMNERINRPEQPYIPNQIADYNKWHKIFDEFSWLIKVAYSDNATIKSKKFRIDTLFQNYLINHEIDLNKINKVFPNHYHSSNFQTIKDDLQRGWYSELAFLMPLKESTIGLTYSDFNINHEISNSRFTFPSWKIIISYYSVYFYIRCITLQKNDNFRLEQHNSSINTFKNCTFNPLKKVLLKFPFDISYFPDKRFYRKDLYINKLNHIKYKYSNHPRPPYLSPFEIFEDIYSTFKERSKTNKKPIIYTLFDFYLEFRIWANYQNINNLLCLQNSGYKVFIDQHISLMLFFIAGFAELCFIANFKGDKYINYLQEFYDLFISKNHELDNSFVNTGMYQRYLIYKSIGYINKNINMIEKGNLNELILKNQG